MKAGTKIQLECKLSDAAFSGEKLFEIALEDGTTYTGLAPTGYCYVEGKRLAYKQKIGNGIEGAVDARVFKNGGPAVIVETPTGELIQVSVEIIAEVEEGERSCVPVR